MTWFDYVSLGLFALFQWQLRRLDNATAQLFLRGEKRTGAVIDRLNDVGKATDEAHRRCSEALKSKTEHEARIRELYERCNSLQAQINVANRAAEHARGVRK